MKVKKLLSVLGLGLFAAVSVGAGVALNKGAKAEAVKADDPETAMFSLYLNASSLETSYVTSNYRAHVWGTNIDTIFAMHPTGQDHVYSVIIYLTDAQVVSGAQFIFTQSECEYPGDKYSENLNLYSTVTESSEIGSSINNGIAYGFKGTTDWTDGHWGTTYRDVKQIPQVAYTDHTGGTTTWYNFILEPENHRYAYYDMVITARYVDMISFDIPNNTSIPLHPYNMFNKFAEACTDGVSGSDYWTYLNEPGTYDIFIENSFDGEGILSIKKQTSPEDTYIYYVTESASATTDYIYSWGGSEQFGAFPGTSIASLVAADKAEEVTGNGVIHFQGGETAKLIYKINIKTGYPSGDMMFMFDNGTDEYKSAERMIQSERAYWWTGDANDDAMEAIKFLEIAETFRNSATDYSVCNISKGNATTIVNVYNGYSDTIRNTYIDCTTVYTWTDKTHTENKLWSYRKVVEQLGEIAGVDPVGAERYIGNSNFEVDTNNSIATIVIISVVSISVISLAAILVVKKRKHQ